MLKNAHRNILLFLFSPCRISLVWVPWVICLGGFFLSIFLFYPGVVGPSGYAQFYQMKEGIIGDWHPPIMAATWQLCQATGSYITGQPSPGDGMIYVLWTAMIWAGLLLILLSGRSFWKNKDHSQKKWITVFLLAIVLLYMPIDFFDELRNIAKDTGMVAAYLMAVGCLLNASAKGWLRWFVLGAALFFIFYGTAIRHNAIFSAIPLLCWLVLIAIPTKRLSVVLPCSLILWGVMLVMINFVNYNVIGAVRLYPLQERFFADILHLNARTQFVPPPNAFGNDFTGIDDETFRKNFDVKVLFIENATKKLKGKFPEKKLAFTQDLIVLRTHDESGLFEDFPLLHEEGKTSQRILSAEFVRTQYPKDYPVLRQAWISRILQDPVTYVKFKTVFFVKFCRNNSLYFLGLNSLFLLPIIMGISISPFFTKGDLRQRNFLSAILAWSALLYILPLWMFLPDDSLRYLLWFFAASIMSIILFCSESNLIRSIIGLVSEHWEKTLSNQDDNTSS